MSWEHFIYFAIASVLLWAVGAWAAWRNRSAIAYSATILGLLVFFAFILMMWISLERPPLRTMGETRLWYSFFLPLAGLIVYSRWKYKWILSFSTILALVFICVNLFKPEIHDKTLMPALQSPWFAPHAKNSTSQIISFMSVLPSSPSACSLAHFGPRKPGGTTGRGIPKRRGPLSPGSHILYMYIIVSSLVIANGWLSGYSSVRSSYCKCVGGASIISLPPKVRVYIHII